MFNGLLRKLLNRGPSIPIQQPQQRDQSIPLTEMRQFGNTGNPLMVPKGAGRIYEDASLVNGPQGFHPANMDVATFQNPTMQSAGDWAEDSYTPTEALFKTGYFNPQTTLHGGYNQPADLDSLRKLLRY